jgi:predicted phosphodiesterase
MIIKMEKILLRKAFVVSDTHNCSEEELYWIARLARDQGCNIIIHAGDLDNKHMGHPAWSEFEVYVCWTILNKNHRFKLPPNWHLLKRVNNFLHFNYIGYDGLMKEYCININHKLGMVCTLGKESQIYKLVEKINKIFQSIHKWVNTIIVGHSHHASLHCSKGMKILNPGAWVGKRCFVILKPGSNHIRFYSLTENEIMVVPVDDLGAIFR